MARSDTLREEVAQIVADLATGDGEAPGPPMVEDYAVADAVLPVVLAAVAVQIEALHLPPDEMQPSGWNHGKRDVLALVTQLGEAVSDGE